MFFGRRKAKNTSSQKNHRESPKVSAYHLPKMGRRFQFDGLIVQFNSEFNVWRVINTTEPNWKNILHEIIGIENETVAIDWALKYLKNKKTNK